MNCPSLDEKGLVKIANAFMLYFPWNNTIVPLKVARRLNIGAELFEYGLINYTSGAHAAGVVPAQTATSEILFNYSQLDPSIAPDMWHHREDNKIYHAYVRFIPEFLRVFVRWPQGATPQEFRGLIPSSDVGVSTDFGFTHGTVETAFPPSIRAGWIIANPTNVDVYCYANIIYGEYETEFISDPNIIWNMMKKNIPNHTITIGGRIEIPDFQDMLDHLKAKALPLMPHYTNDTQAIQKLREALQ